MKRPSNFAACEMRGFLLGIKPVASRTLWNWLNHLLTSPCVAKGPALQTFISAQQVYTVVLQDLQII